MVHHDSVMCLLYAKLRGEEGFESRHSCQTGQGSERCTGDSSKKIVRFSNPNHGIDRFVDDKTAAKKSEVSKFFVQQEKTRVLCR
jgi:hypothetical protein